MVVVVCKSRGSDGRGGNQRQGKSVPAVQLGPSGITEAGRQAGRQAESTAVAER